MTSNCKRASFHPSVKQLTPFTDKRWTNLSNKTTREVSPSIAGGSSDSGKRTGIFRHSNERRLGRSAAISNLL